MRALLLIAVAAVAVPDRPAPTPKEKAKPLAEQVLGKWLLVKHTLSGQDKKADGSIIVFTPTELEMHDKGQRTPEQDASYQLDAGKKPAAIDIVPKQDGTMKIEGILKVEGNTLTFCFPFGGGKTANRLRFRAQ